MFVGLIRNHNGDQSESVFVSFLVDFYNPTTLSTGKKYIHLGLSGAGIVGKHAIAMTTFALGAVVLKIKVKIT